MPSFYFGIPKLWKKYHFLTVRDTFRHKSTKKSCIRVRTGGEKMENYRINTKTLAIIPINKKKTKIYENDNVIIVNTNAKKIIQENCRYFGSSYEGRKRGTMEMIGVTHKAPICIEESNNIIFFPTSSPRLNDCGWISLGNVDGSIPYDDEALIRFENNLTLQVNASNKIINNQILRATRLESVLSKRKSHSLSEQNHKKS